jgi:hypothetical protein
MPRLTCQRERPLAGEAISIVKRRVASVGLIAAAALAGASGAHSAATATLLCVGGPHCYPTVQAALDASVDGDTIKVGPGTFAGGITITKSISLIGSGAGATVVRGGGPVITIGQSFTGPTLNVSIARLTITGGVNTTTPVPFDPFGGGVLIYPTAAGATNVVTISDSVVTGNSSGAEGGGIADIGQLTLTNSVISSNEAGSAAGQRAKGGGIWTASPGGTGSLTMRNVFVVGNTAEKDGGDDFRIEGGGIEVQDGETFSISNSLVRGNRLSYSSSSDAPTDVLVDGAGIRVGDDGSAAIANTTISDNVALADAPLGEPTAASVGLVVGASRLMLTNSTISGNRVSLVAASTADPGPSGSALEFDGQATISNVRVVDNSTAIRVSSGVAGATGAVLSLDQYPQAALLTSSVISGNSVTVASATGSATIQGVAITNNGELELRNDLISGNTGTALAPSGFAQGGGIWNGEVFAPPPLSLLVQDSGITGNVVTGSPGVNVAGGGIFTTSPITLAHSLVAGNRPNQCTGC